MDLFGREDSSYRVIVRVGRDLAFAYIVALPKQLVPAPLLERKRERERELSSSYTVQVKSFL
jgi:hypothetical protein